MVTGQQEQEEPKTQKRTYKDWEKEFNLGKYADSAKLTKEQYIAIKKKEIRTENAKKMFGLISTVAEKITHNFREGQMEGFDNNGQGGNMMDQIGSRAQNSAMNSPVGMNMDGTATRTPIKKSKEKKKKNNQED